MKTYHHDTTQRIDELHWRASLLHTHPGMGGAIPARPDGRDGEPTVCNTLKPITTMTATITIEEFDNGITLRWESPDNPDTPSIVALDREKELALGKMIWEDVKMMMDTKLTSIVKMNIEYMTDNE